MLSLMEVDFSLVHLEEYFCQSGLVWSGFYLNCFTTAEDLLKITALKIETLLICCSVDLALDLFVLIFYSQAMRGEEKNISILFIYFVLGRNDKLTNCLVCVCLLREYSSALM